MNELLFGSAYYAEYMPYDRIEEDIRMMKRAGMNVVRIAESTWSTLEPESGTYNFSYIDKVLQTAEQEGMQVIIGTPTYAIPSWLERAVPAVMAETVSGRNRYGHRQLMDIMNEDFRFYAERVIRRLMAHTAENSCVIGFQIDNETKHYDTSNSYVQSLFVQHLKQVFRDTERMNKAFVLEHWSNSIRQWEDFPDMKGCINGGLAGEFDKFRRMLAADYLGWQAAIVSKYKKEAQFITHNVDFSWKKFGAEIAQDGYSYGVQPDADHAAVNKYLTLTGADIYHPTQDELTGAEIAFCGDELRTLKQEPYLVLECQAQAFKYWTPYPGQLRQHAYSHLASGAAGILYWNWHSIHNGYETYWRGLLSHDLETNPAYEEAKLFGQEWQQHGADQLIIRKENKIAFVIDNETLTGLEWFPIDKELSYNDVVRWLYDSLYEMNIECDVVFAKELDVEKYEVIITPALYSIQEETLLSIRRFVERGGVLISTFKSFVADEHLRVYHKKQPHILHECFGISYNQFTEPGRAKLRGRDIKYWMELLKPEGAEVLAQYEHKYWGNYAAVTHHQYGNGHTCYLGCYVEKDLLKQLLQEIFYKVGLTKWLPEAQWPVIIRNGINQNGDCIHYLFNYQEDDSKVSCPYGAVTDILTGEVFQYGDVIQLKEWGIRVLQEKGR